MKTECSMEPFPVPDREDLNIPGQNFAGEISDGKLHGIFEVLHEKYNGINAPAFPFNPEPYKFREIYLQAEDRIESDDPAIKNMAFDLTEGSADLWEAACRISKWVTMNIDGSILDGSALETFNSRSGLCGAQSLLTTALCRAAGIPSRVVWGCMYTREQEGSFGHHAWNEVFVWRCCIN